MAESEVAITEGRLDDAQRILEPAIRGRGDDPDVRKMQARIEEARAHTAFAKGQTEEALRLFEKAESIGGPSDATDFNVGMILARTGRTEEARARLMRAAQSTNQEVAARARAGLDALQPRATHDTLKSER
jgi:Flp pilus assembly protein TadD